MGTFTDKSSGITLDRYTGEVVAIDAHKLAARRIMLDIMDSLRDFDPSSQPMQETSCQRLRAA